MDTNTLMIILLVGLAPPGQDEVLTIKMQTGFATATTCAKAKTKELAALKAARRHRFYEIRCVPVRGAKP